MAQISNNTNPMTSHQLISELFRIAKTRKITHQLIADRTGKHRPHITAIASSKQDPTLNNFIMICEAVGVEVKLTDLNQLSN